MMEACKFCLPLICKKGRTPVPSADHDGPLPPFLLFDMKTLQTKLNLLIVEMCGSVIYKAKSKSQPTAKPKAAKAKARRVSKPSTGPQVAL